MKFDDAIFNWLQIAVVAEVRPDDLSAKETADFFKKLLIEDHQITTIRYERDPLIYTVYYEKDGKEEKMTFGLDLVDKLIDDIEKEPKYDL